MIFEIKETEEGIDSDPYTTERPCLFSREKCRRRPLVKIWCKGVFYPQNRWYQGTNIYRNTHRLRYANSVQLLFGEMISNAA